MIVRFLVNVVLLILSSGFFLSSKSVYSQNFSVMTYNIRYDNPDDEVNWWQFRKDDVKNLINFYDPGILGIQEGLQHQVNYLNDQLEDYDYVGVGRDDGKTRGEYSAIFFDSTEFQFVNTSTFWLSETPEVVSVGWDASMERICTYGQFIHKKSERIIHVFNAHFDHIGQESRLNAANLIIKKIFNLANGKESIVVMGDFNCTPESKPLQMFKNQLQDPDEIESVLRYGPLGTYNGFQKEWDVSRRIDYVLYKNLKLTRYQHIDDRRNNDLWVSDHLPVMATFSY